MAIEDVLARIRGQEIGATDDGRMVDRGFRGPVQRNRPKNLTALQNKWGNPEYQQAVSQLPEPVVRALQQTDMRRIDRGQSPVTAENSVKAGIAATTGQQVTPVSDRRDTIMSIPANAVGDLAQIVKSLPQLPAGIVREVGDVMDGFEDDRRELAKEGKTGLEATLNLPGVRMLPGTFIANNLLYDRQAFIEDPLLNVLDALPFASKAARSTSVVKAAEEAQLAARTQGLTNATVGVQPGVIPKPIRPIKTALTRTLDDQGKVVPNRLGELMDKGWDTKPGQALRGAFGQQASDPSRLLILDEQEAMHRVTNPASGDIPGQTFAEWMRLQDPDNLLSEYNITPERASEISYIATRDPRSLASLPENEIRFVDKWRADTKVLGDYLAERGEVIKRGDEYFAVADGKKLNRAFDLAAKKAAAIFGDVEVGGKNRGVMDDIDALADIDPRWAQVRGMLDAEDFSSAGRLIGELTEGEAIIAASKRINQFQVYNNRLAGINDRRMYKIRSMVNEAAAMQKNYAKLRANINPARFDELINKKAAEAFMEWGQSRSLFPDMAAVERYFREGTLDQLPGWADDPLVQQTWSKIRADTRRTWEALKAAGEDPVFMSRVDPKRAERIGQARFDGTNMSIPAARRRVSDVSPGVNSPFVAMTSEAWDIVQSEGMKASAETIQQRYGRSAQSVFDETTPLAEAAVRAKGLGEGNLAAERSRIIKQKYMPFDPASMMPFAGGVSPLSEAIYIPRVVGETLQRINSQGLSNLRAYSDPVTRLWRVALLPLSPRWHLYNTFGGAMMTSVIAGPQAFRQTRLANEILKAVKEGQPLPRHIPREIERQIGLMGREEAQLAFKRGATAKKWADNAAVRGSKKFIEWSYDLNSKMDDFYKMVSYLEGEAQALARFKKQGLADDVALRLAQEEGIRVSRMVLQDVGGMTPFERGLLRQIFPFYSWLGHLARVVYQFPADHPWRAAVTASMSRMVLEDLGDGATVDMLDLLSWGEPDEQGNRPTINMRGLNPFSDAANLFTLAGWLGSTNPLFQTAFQALGFDSMQGGIDLYPQMSYSPETGKMVVDTGNPLQNLAVNSLPQLGSLVRYMGRDQDFNKLMREDPATAQRILLGGIGIPGSYRRTSTEQELINNELRRQDAATLSQASAFRTGNLDALVPFLGQEAVDALKQQRAAGELDQYLPSTTPTALPGG